MGPRSVRDVPKWICGGQMQGWEAGGGRTGRCGSGALPLQNETKVYWIVGKLSGSRNHVQLWIPRCGYRF
eukprot:5293353-Pyramimonas_sp.AAC.1